VPQLTTGLIFFLLGGSDLIRRSLPQTSLVPEALQWLAICCCIAVIWGAKVLQERVVSTRGGYVELRRKWPQLTFALFGLVLVALLAPLGWLPSLDSRLVVPGFAIAFAGTTLGYAWRDKSSLLICFGVYLLCLAPFLWWLPVGEIERGDSLQVGAGAPLAVGGAFILRRFLNANPRRSETNNE
jgi:hypothetical protein